MLRPIVQELVDTLNDCSTTELVRVYNEVCDKNVNPEEVETDEFTQVFVEKPHR
jgi:hypothetical protein